MIFVQPPGTKLEEHSLRIASINTNGIDKDKTALLIQLKKYNITHTRNTKNYPKHSQQKQKEIMTQYLLLILKTTTLKREWPHLQVIDVGKIGR